MDVNSTKQAWLDAISAETDPEAKDSLMNLYHEIFFPNKEKSEAKHYADPKCSHSQYERTGFASDYDHYFAGWSANAVIAERKRKARAEKQADKPTGLSYRLPLLSPSETDHLFLYNGFVYNSVALAYFAESCRFKDDRKAVREFGTPYGVSKFCLDKSFAVKKNWFVFNEEGVFEEDKSVALEMLVDIYMAKALRHIDVAAALRNCTEIPHNSVYWEDPELSRRMVDGKWEGFDLTYRALKKVKVLLEDDPRFDENVFERLYGPEYDDCAERDLVWEAEQKAWKQTKRRLAAEKRAIKKPKKLTERQRLELREWVDAAREVGILSYTEQRVLDRNTSYTDNDHIDVLGFYHEDPNEAKYVEELEDEPWWGEE